jgi:hypothetical protein
MITRPCSVRVVSLTVLTLTAILFSKPAILESAQGDCAQPVTSGSSPGATDCLFILRAAVGSVTCDPACICAPGGSLPTTATDSLVCLEAAVGETVTLSCPCDVPQEGDDFNDNSKDSTKWGKDYTNNQGVLAETDHVLEYTCKKGTKNDQSLRPWKASRFPYNADWKLQLDVANSTSVVDDDQYASLGILVWNPNDPGSQFFGELYAWGGAPPIKGFFAALFKKGDFKAMVDTWDLPATAGAVRIAFDASTKVITFFYRLDGNSTGEWVEYGSFGLAGSGGADGNADWNYSKDDRFQALVYGYSAHTAVTSGQMNGDNFLATGGIPR